MGLIVPTAVLVMLPVVWALNQFGWHAAAQAPFWIGPILVYVVLPLLDREYGPDGENPARRGDGAVGERQVLPLLHVQLHPVPVRHASCWAPICSPPRT